MPKIPKLNIGRRLHAQMFIHQHPRQRVVLLRPHHRLRSFVEALAPLSLQIHAPLHAQPLLLTLINQNVIDYTLLV